LLLRNPHVIQDQIRRWRLAICFRGKCLMVEEGSAKFNIPPYMSASHRVATNASAVQIQEWNGVYQAESDEAASHPISKPFATRQDLSSAGSAFG
jgi:hypothetical protein